jgi:hypothetical protein
MTLAQLFEEAKQGTLPLTKAVFLKHNPHLPPSSELSQSDLIATLATQEVLLFDTLEEGRGFAFIGSTAYLAEGMQLCDDFEEFVVNVSGW